MLKSFGLFAVALLAGCASTQYHHPEFGADCTALQNGDVNNVDCVTVYYGTNRLVSAARTLASDTEEDVSSVKANDAGRLSLGRADVWLPMLVEKGGTREAGETPMLKGDTPNDPEELSKYVFLTRITAAGKERFVTDLQSAVDDGASGSILLFIHGFNVDFEPALIRSAQLSVDLSRDEAFDAGTPVLFSWPSNGSMSLSSYRSDRDRSAAAAPHLNTFLDLLTKDVSVQRINIIAHSMGNRVLVGGLEEYARQYLEDSKRNDVEFRIILAAADVDRDIFDQTTGILDALDANVTIYTSDADRALHISNLINEAKRLGDTDGNRPYIREHDRYETVDATNVATELFGLGHGYYADNPFILGDMKCAMRITEPSQRALAARRYGDDPKQLEYFQIDATRDLPQDTCSLYRDTAPNTDPSLIRADAPAPMMPQPRAMPVIIAPEPPIAAPPEEVMMQSVETDITLYFHTGAAANDEALYQAELGPALAQGTIRAITIHAHTDAVGSRTQNFELSQARADAVRDWLIAQGIDPRRIMAIGFGEENPAVQTGPDEAQPLNRRVVVQFEYE